MIRITRKTWVAVCLLVEVKNANYIKMNVITDYIRRPIYHLVGLISLPFK